MTEKISNDVKPSKNTDTKQLNATFFNDTAIELELLEKQLRLDKHFSKRRQRDQAFVELAFKALQYCVECYKRESSTKYPTYEAMMAYVTSNAD